MKMAIPGIDIVEFDDTLHTEEVTALWETVFGYEAEHNDPRTAIRKKVARDDDLFFVALKQKSVIGTIMAGYDGHRGWIYAMAVHPASQKQGVGTKLLAHAQARLKDLGCLKLNLQIMAGNESVQRFYAANGFLVEKRVSMGKKLY